MKKSSWLLTAFLIALPVTAQLKVAVFPFYNETLQAKNDWLSHGFCESLINDLAEDNTINVTDRPDVLAEIKAKGYKVSDMKDDQKALIVARSLEVDKMIIGVFDMPEGSVKALAKFYDVRTGVPDAKNTYNATGKFTMTNVYAMYGQIANKALVSFGKKSIEEIGGPSKGVINVDAYEPYIKGILQYDESSTVEDYMKAVELFKQATAIDTNYGLAFAGIAKAYAKIARIHDINFKTAEKQESYNQALAAGSRAVKLDKNLAAGWTALALTYREIKDREKLMDAAKRAIRIRPNQYDAYDMLADAYSANFFRENKNIDSSIFYRKKCVEFNNKFASGFRGLGRDYFDKGEYKSAEEAFLRAISLNPKHAGSHDLIGQVYFMQGQYNKAKEEFGAAEKLDAKNAFAPTHLGDVLSMESNYKEAIAAYEAALTINANFALAHNGLAWIYLAAKDKTVRDKNKAVASAQSAVTISESKNGTYLATLAEAQFAAGQGDAAIATINTALALDAENTDYKEALRRYKFKEKNSEYIYVMRRGNLYLRQNRAEDGIKEFEEANKLSPKNVYILYTLAKYYDSKKEYKKAFNTYYQARECDWDKLYINLIQARMNELAPYMK